MKILKYKKILLFFIITIIAIIFAVNNWSNKEENLSDNNGITKRFVNSVSFEDLNLNSDANINLERKSLIEGDLLNDGVTETEYLAMENNTKYLQELVDKAEIGQTIELPPGIYYFASGGINSRGTENYAIKLRSNVSLVGAGTNESDNNKNTILKPYAPAGTITYGLDMFYYNELVDSEYKSATYLENVYFNDFIIDGANVRGEKYNSSGKGFMINLCKNCHWNNVIVKNTDATGFGMDSTINSSIINCKAINCGKNADKWEGGKDNAPGASGFGIGTGYSNDESMYIKNCESIGNAKYGFFFEHQGRFNGNYTATTSQGFIVEDSYSKGNLYNYGGERSNDVIYLNCTSEIDNYTKNEINFSNQSRRAYMINMKLDAEFKDVSNKSSYYKAIYWNVKNNYMDGNSNNEFGMNDNVTRANAVTYLWRMDGRNGNVVLKTDYESSNGINIAEYYNDVSNDSTYANSIKWAHDSKIITGSASKIFEPNKNITRADFVFMLWKYAGSPVEKEKYFKFKDVNKGDYYYEAINWAYKNKIIVGKTSTKFEPLANCKKEELAMILYNYGNAKKVKHNITYYLLDGKLENEYNSYTSGEKEISISNPIREGYIFKGWKGSDLKELTKKVSISKSDTGNKAYFAVYEPIKYTIKYDANGGSGNMEPITAVYDKFVKLSENKFSKEGATFKGWSLNKNQIDFYDAEIAYNIIENNNDHVTLYAIWEEKNKIEENKSEENKTEENKIEENKENEAINVRTNIFVGDSTLHEMHLVVGNTNEIWSAQRGAGIDWVRNYGIPKVSEKIGPNTNLIFRIGVNNLFYNNELHNPQDIVNLYINYLQNNISSWRKKDVKVYFLSSGPVDDTKIGDGRIVNDATIKQFNVLLKEALANPNNGLTDVKYIDIYSEILGEFNKSDLTRSDGTHGIAIFYRIMYGIIKKNINQDYSEPLALINQLNDVNSESMEAVRWALSNSYVNLQSDTSFGSTNTITNSEAIDYIWKFQGMPYEAPTSDFTFKDVSNDDLVYDAVVWAHKNKISYGINTSTFGKNTQTTKVNFLTYIWRLAGSPIVSTNYKYTYIREQDYYYEALNWAIKNNLIDESEVKTITKEKNCTKIEATYILYNYYKNIK